MFRPKYISLKKYWIKMLRECNFGALCGMERRAEQEQIQCTKATNIKFSHQKNYTDGVLGRCSR